MKKGIYVINLGELENIAHVVNILPDKAKKDILGVAHDFIQVRTKREGIAIGGKYDTLIYSTKSGFYFKKPYVDKNLRSLVKYWL